MNAEQLRIEQLRIEREEKARRRVAAKAARISRRKNASKGKARSRAHRGHGK